MLGNSISAEIEHQGLGEIVTGTKAKITRLVLITCALAFISVFLVLPLLTVFSQAFEKGVLFYWKSLHDPYTLKSVRLTLLTAAIAVPLNVAFGISLAWLVTRFKFFGRNTLLTCLDLPLAVSPVIAGMIFVLLYGSRGLLGPLLETYGIKIIFAVPAIVLTTTFVTVPFVARELIPLMQEQGSHEEQAALTLGASGWMTFRYVTLPNIKWGLLYGIILCNSRAMGEFGAVSVVSGHIRGLTNTMPLHIEVLYNEYNFAASFAVASLLTLLALVTLVAKRLIEWRHRRSLA